MHIAQFLWVLLLVAPINLLIGGYVLATKPRDPVRQAFFLFVIATTMWTTGFFMLSITHDFRYDKVTLYGGLLIVTSLLWFAQQFPRPIPLRVPAAALYFPLLAGAAVLVPSGKVIHGIVSAPNGDFTVILGPLFPLWTTLLLVYVLVSLGLLIAQYRRAHGTERMRLRYFLLGIFVFVLSALIFDTVIPAFGSTSFKILGPLSSIVFTSLAGYAIVRHQLMDIRVVIQRGLIYTVLLTACVLLYLGLISALGYAWGGTSRETVLVSAGIVMLAGIFGTPIVSRYFRKWTDPFFYKDTYDYATAMQDLSEALYAATTYETLITDLEARLAQILRASRVCICLNERLAPVVANEILRVPIRLDRERIGAIIVGEKRSGDPYTPQDRQLLTTFSYQAATALARVRLYAQVKRHARDLERKVDTRTKEIRSLQEEQRRMMIDLSHNLQTPLAILKSKLDRAGRFFTKDGDMQSLEQSVDALSRFIYELLALSTLERTLKEERSAVSLTKLMREVVEEVSVIAEASGITVVSDIADEVVVSGNERPLHEAVMNLASNAVKYMRHDGDRTIRFLLSAEGDQALITVEDTGMGIPEKDLPRIFERFYRGRAKEYEGHEGNGLGLAIVKRIIEEHGGTVRATSTPGVGSSFMLSLPLQARSRTNRRPR